MGALESSDKSPCCSLLSTSSSISRSLPLWENCHRKKGYLPVTVLLSVRLAIVKLGSSEIWDEESKTFSSFYM